MDHDFLCLLGVYSVDGALVMAVDARVLMDIPDADEKKCGFSRHRLAEGYLGVSTPIRRIDEIDDELEARRAAFDHEKQFREIHEMIYEIGHLRGGDRQLNLSLERKLQKKCHTLSSNNYITIL